MRGWLLSQLLALSLSSGSPEAVHLVMGAAVVPLNGPWKFQPGDNPLWASPSFDDTNWETVDLTPPPGAHDSDVGLKGYVPGWQARAHRGYSGYAWYRTHVLVRAPSGDGLSLLGPFYVDSAYQLRVNGQLLGGAGEFSGPTPTAYNNHEPRLFPLPSGPEAATPEGDIPLLVAIRVWMGPWALSDPEAGGIHIAPVLGTARAAEMLYRLQWLDTVLGYVVDGAEAVVFVLLAVMACTLIPFDRSNPAYARLAVALLLIALRRANQPLFFWWHFETVQEFELLTRVLLIPLCLGAWTVAWGAWFGERPPSRTPAIALALTLLYCGSECLGSSWFQEQLPHFLELLTRPLSVSLRLLFLLLTVSIVVRSLRQTGREKWIGLLAMLLLSVGLFADEVSRLGVPGIWFPYGVGVSRTQYAYAAFDGALFVALLRRLYILGRATGPDAAGVTPAPARH